MPSDEQARMRALGVRLNPTPMPGFQGSRQTFDIDKLTGRQVSRPSTTTGLGFGGSIDEFGNNIHEPLSTPRVASMSESNGYVHGGNFQQDIPFVPIGVVTEAARTADTRGLDFLKLDPNTTPAPGSDTADKRKLRNGSAVFG